MSRRPSLTQRRALRAWSLAALLGMAAVVLTACSAMGTGTGISQVEFTHPLTFPAVLSGDRGPDGTRTYDLTAEAGTTDFGMGGPADTIGLNGSYLGPTLRMTRGERVKVRVRNDLDEMTTLHWHGLHVPARMDGGPHQMIEPGTTWRPRWTVDQPAATLWYHSHPHGETAQQVYRGLAGMLLIDDPEADGAGLPAEYGVDDLPLVVQDKTFVDDGQLVVDPIGHASTGFLGDTIVVNGVVGAFHEVTTEAVRLRLLNASNSRFYNFGLSDGREFQMVASDGGLLPQPLDLDRIQLSPGERAEIVVRFSPGETVALASYPPDLGHSIGTSERFGSGTFDVVQFRAAPSLTASAPVAPELADVPAPDAATATTTRRFGITDTAINGRPMDMGRIDQVVPIDTSEVWEVTNQNPQPHNFHVHDGSFRVLTIDGAAPPPQLAGYKDTVYVAPRSTVRLLVRFTDYADPTWPYMFHCHLLLHEDMGVMGQFVVVRPGDKVVPPPRPHDSHNLGVGQAPVDSATAPAETQAAHTDHSVRSGG